MTTRILFVRHGEIANPKKIIYGRLPHFGLTLKGRQEMSQAAEQLAKDKITALYASPLLRTRQSANIVNKYLHLPIHYSNYLLEVDTPMLGKTMDYVRTNTVNYNVFRSQENNTAGETIYDVAERMRKFIDNMKKNHAGENVVAVTHGDPIMIVKAMVDGLPLIIDSLRPKEKMIGHGKIYLAEFNS